MSRLSWRLSLGVIEYQMETFNNALRATEHASTSLKNGASIGTAISVAGRLKPETRQAMKDDFKEKNAGGANAGNLMILEEGAKLERATMTMAEFQFIESRKLTSFKWGEHDCCLFACDAALGITGNSHMLMMDKNSDQIAARIQSWIEQQGLTR